MSDGEFTIPRDEQAERAVLGICLVNPNAYREAAKIVGHADFYYPRNARIWEHIGRCIEAQGVADPVVVHDSIRSAGDLHLVPQAGPYLATLYGTASPFGVAPYARIVAELAVRRRLIMAGQRMIQRAESGEGEIADLLDGAATDVRDARDSHAGVEVLSVPIAEFMATRAEEPTWVIPGLLARQDRLVLTGNGGLGKSTLLQQIAVCAASGIQPFDWHKGRCYDPAKVLIIDCENPDHDLQTRLWKLMHLAEQRSDGDGVADRLTVAGHGNPIDLFDGPSAMSILATVEHDQPDLVYIGPYYKLHNDDPDKETTVKKVTGVIDQIRAMGCSVIMEAHINKEGKRGGSMEPSGSNMWNWWPEFGIGLRLDDDAPEAMRLCVLERWRIDRVQRDWPDAIEQGGSWPWRRSA